MHPGWVVARVKYLCTSPPASSGALHPQVRLTDCDCWPPLLSDFPFHSFPIQFGYIGLSLFVPALSQNSRHEAIT